MRSGRGRGVYETRREMVREGRIERGSGGDKGEERVGNGIQINPNK